MSSYTDQMGNSITLPQKPQRIISIVPSQSEFLWEIGLQDRLVGITKFCIHPEEMFRTIERVGGTKKLDIDRIRRLKPDLIIGNKEENEFADIDILKKEFPVWMSDIITFEDAFSMMQQLGEITGENINAATMIKELRADITKIKDLFAGRSVIYFIWKDPYMFAGKQTFIDHVLSHLGLDNVVTASRYPEFTSMQVKSLKPDLCFLSSEPYPFKEKHVGEIKMIFPDSKVIIVDGEIFSWYGSRLKLLASYAQTLAKTFQELH